MIMGHDNIPLHLIVPALIQRILIDEVASYIINFHLVTSHWAIELFSPSRYSQHFQPLLVPTLSIKRTITELVLGTVVVVVGLDDAFLLVF